MPPSRSHKAAISAQVASSSGTGLPSACIWALSMTRMWMSFSRLFAPQTGSQSRRLFSFVSSPRMAQRAAMPSINSSGMPRSVRTGTSSASRPRKVKARLTVTLGRSTCTRAGRQRLALRRPANRGGDAMAQRLDEGAAGRRLAHIEQAEAAVREAEPAVSGQDVALDVGELDIDRAVDLAHERSTPGGWVGPSTSPGRTSFRNLPNASYSACGSAPWFSIAKCVSIC